MELSLGQAWPGSSVDAWSAGGGLLAAQCVEAIVCSGSDAVADELAALIQAQVHSSIINLKTYPGLKRDTLPAGQQAASMQSAWLTCLVHPSPTLLNPWGQGKWEQWLTDLIFIIFARILWSFSDKFGITVDGL